jgi:peptidoglycan/xylan/chitin deacetylase (PgdA/CDA1 family)
MGCIRAGVTAAAWATAVGFALAAVSASAQSPMPGQAGPIQATSNQATADQATAERAQPAQGQPAEAQPAQAQPAQAKPTQAQPAEAQPAQAQPQTAPDKEQAQDKTKEQDKSAITDVVQSRAQTASQTCPGNPDALGTSRVLPIDFSEYQQVGRMQYPDSLPLNDKEVVLTFDDGPLPPSTDKVLDTLAAQCVKATFFMVGEMARAFPATVRRVYEEGHTIGTHSDHHPTGFGKLPLERMRAEIDGGIADVSAAFGGDSRYLAPFFRIPGFARSDLVESELAERGLIVFSADVVADDWHRDITPAKIIALAMSRLEKRGKGILLLHDIHPKTAAALPGLLEQLKANGFHIVQVVPSAAYEIAMARKPAAETLASAMPGELALKQGTPPAWPQTADKLMPDDIVLPVPDPAAFEPETVLSDESAAVQWPDAPKSTATPRGHQRAVAERTARRRDHVARSAERERAQRDRHTDRRAAGHHPHVGIRADGHRADLMTRIRAVAALFSPATSTR